MFNRRMIITLVSGALLGVFCVIGANLRYSGTLSNLYVFAFWFNRLLLGFVLGLITINHPLMVRLIRGLLIGLLVSFAFYSSTEFLDFTGFIAGGVYGIIIEFAAYKLEKKRV